MLLFITKVMSSGALALVGSFILLNKKFDKHPYPLMGWACLAQAIFYYNLCEVQIFYNCKLYKIVTWPFYFVVGPLGETFS